MMAAGSVAPAGEMRMVRPLAAANQERSGDGTVSGVMVAARTGGSSGFGWCLRGDAEPIQRLGHRAAIVGVTVGDA